MANDYPDELRRWRTKLEEAKAVRSEWESEVREAVKAGSPAPEMPERAVEPERPPRPRIVITDITPEAAARQAAAHQKGLLLHRDELAGFIGNFDRYGS